MSKNNKNLRNIGLNITKKGLKKAKNNLKSDIVIKNKGEEKCIKQN